MNTYFLNGKKTWPDQEEPEEFGELDKQEELKVDEELKGREELPRASELPRYEELLLEELQDQHGRGDNDM